MTSFAASTDSARADAGPRRRRVPLWAVALVGALAAAAYATLFEKMHFGPPLVMLTLGGMTLALTGAALYRVIDPLSRERGAAPPVRTGRRLRELEREKQLVLKAIKEIELDYQMRKVAERDYREMVERYRTRAMRLITEIEAGDDYRALIEREVALRLKLAPSEAAAARGAGDGGRCRRAAESSARGGLAPRLFGLWDHQRRGRAVLQEMRPAFLIRLTLLAALAVPADGARAADDGRRGHAEPARDRRAPAARPGNGGRDGQRPRGADHARQRRRRGRGVGHHQERGR